MTANLSRVVPVLRPLALAAAAAATLSLTALSAAAQTQYYDYSGSVYTYPFDFFPIDRFVSFYDMTGNVLGIGNSAPGSFSMFAGAWLKADNLSVGNGGTGSGQVDVSGASARLELGGTGNRLEIGNWGEGSLTVSAGALVDASMPSDACADTNWWCQSVIGNTAGSTGTLTVTGSGSEVRTLRQFTVGGGWVDTGFGTPGGTTHATLNVLHGGTLRTEHATVAANFGGPAALGTEHTVANVTIDGAGSQWIVTRNSVDNDIAFFVAGTQANALATINISNGGKLIIDGTGSIGPYDGITLGVNGGRADLTVSGIGSAVEVNAANPFINVGRSGATGQGSFSVLAGASASAMFLTVGRDLARGDLLIDGASSKLTLSGVGTPGVDGPAGASIGRDGGTGFATVRNGGHWLITDGGADSRPNAIRGPGMSVGNGAGATGSLLITGAGSTVEIVSTTLGPAPGVPDNYNPGMTVGFLSGSMGTLTVDNGGKLLLTGNAVSTVTDSRTTYLGIGGNSDVDPGGIGYATVSGLGSEIRVSGSDAFIAVGRAGSIGYLTLADKGLVAATDMSVGRVGTGYLIMDNGVLEMSGQQTGNILAGAALTLGNRGGTGMASLANGSRVTITNPGTSGAGLYLGGTPQGPLGTGTLVMTGGSRIEVVAASGLGTLSVGHDGTGIVAMDQGSSIDIGDGSAYIGRTATGVGTVTLIGASTLNAGYVGIGATPGVDTGTGFMIVSDGSTVNAGTVEIGARGLLGGNGGTINADVIIGGAVNPGESPGRIRFNGYVSAKPGGTLMLDILANGEDSFTAVARGVVNPQGVLTPGYDIDQLVIGAGSNFDFSGLTVAMNFLDATNPIEFAESGGLDLDNFMRSADGDTETGLSLVFPEGVHWTDVLANANIVAWTSDESYVGVELEFTGSSEGLKAVVVLVPEPATWAFMLLGLCLLGVLARSRQRSARRALQPAAGARGASVAARTHLCRVAS